MNDLTTFYFLRHGETEYNTKHIVQGQIDSPLTAEGIENIKKLAVKFRDIKFDLAFSSDLLRAKRTAEIIALEHKLAVETTELIRERSFGKYEAQHNSVLDAYYKLFSELSDEEKFTYSKDNVESNEKLMARVITFLRETAIAYPGKTILVASHGTVLRVLLTHLGYGTHKTLPSRSVANLAWARIESDGIDFFVKETEGITFTKE